MKPLSSLVPGGIDVSGEAASTIEGAAGGIRPDDPRSPGQDLERIDAALRRLDLGKFGLCLYCGDQISVRRLDHDPAVMSCSTCDED